MITKLLVVADVHLANQRPLVPDPPPSRAGLNARAHDTLEALAKAAELANQLGAVLVVAGDLFDKDKPSPALIRAAADVLTVYNPHVGPRAIVLLGNHDNTGDGQHALLPLTVVPGIHTITEPKLVPYLGGVQFVPAGEEVIDHPCQTIIAHHGVWDDSTPQFLRVTKGAKSISDVRAIMRRTGAAMYITGDWHAHRVFAVPEGSVVQVGALIPQSFSDLGRDNVVGSAIEVDLDRGLWKRHVIPGPRFVDDPTPADAKSGYYIYTRVQVEADGNLIPLVSADTSDAWEAARETVEVYSTTPPLQAVVDTLLTADAKPEVIGRALEIIAERRLFQ